VARRSIWRTCECSAGPETPSSARTGNALRSAVGRSIELYPPALRLIGTSGAIEQLY
jgi:hypothetical protein